MATRTLFSPPRNKPKLSLPQPTLAVGQPLPMIQTIDRPVNLVDDEGNVHGRLGENPNGPEQVSITPPPGLTSDPAGGPNYASGGTLLIGGGNATWQRPADPNEDNGRTPGSIPTPSPGTSYGPGMPTAPTTPTYPPQQPQQNRPVIATGNSQSNQNVFNMQQQQMQAQNASLDARAHVLDLKTGNQPLQKAVYDARGNVIGAEERQNTLTRGVTQQRQANDQTREQELEGIYAASQNVPDLQNVADATNLYRAEDRRSGKMGVSPEAEVNLPPGYNGSRVAGSRPKIMSQEQRLQEKAGYEDPIRNQKLQLAQDVVSLQATDVQAAQIAANKAGLTLDQANQLVNEAQLQADYSDIISSRRNIELNEAQQPPFPGAVKSPISGNWMTPEQRDKEAIDYHEGTTQPYQTQVQGQNSQYAGLNDSQLLNTIPPKVNGATLTAQNSKPYTEPVRAELIRRYLQQGLNQQQAEQKADAMIAQEFVSRARQGSNVSEVGGAGAVPTQPVAPAAAPTGTGVNLPPGSPVLPPGYH